MTAVEKRVYFLLKVVIYNYHGIDQREQHDLEESSRQMDAQAELDWATQFVAKDYITAFDRAREYLSVPVGDYPKPKRLELIDMIWKANNLKGYVTEMEATAMMRLAKDWSVEKEMMELVLR